MKQTNEHDYATGAQGEVAMTEWQDEDELTVYELDTGDVTQSEVIVAQGQKNVETDWQTMLEDNLSPENEYTVYDLTEVKALNVKDTTDRNG